MFFLSRMISSVNIVGGNLLYINGGITQMNEPPIIINIVVMVPKVFERLSVKNIIGEKMYNWKSAAKYQV
jgi:Ca2+/Na+ antiporter